MKLSKVPIFPKKKIVGKREWGNEYLLRLVSKKYTLKLLEIKKGKSGGLQFHRKKNEVGYLMSGKMLITYASSNGRLKKKIIKKGDTFHFPPGSIHKETALKNCTIIEASTPHFNDRVRVEEKFGIKNNSGLKTTKIKDIKFL